MISTVVLGFWDKRRSLGTISFAKMYLLNSTEEDRLRRVESTPWFLDSLVPYSLSFIALYSLRTCVTPTFTRLLCRCISIYLTYYKSFTCLTFCKPHTCRSNVHIGQFSKLAGHTSRPNSISVSPPTSQLLWAETSFNWGRSGNPILRAEHVYMAEAYMFYSTDRETCHTKCDELGWTCARPPSTANLPSMLSVQTGRRYELPRLG